MTALPTPFDNVTDPIYNRPGLPLFPASLYDPTLFGYVLSGILGALSWDLFSNIVYDYELLWRWPNEIPAATYFISRISTLIFSIVSVIFTTTTDTTRCVTFETIIKWSTAVAIPTTSLLFFYRVRAVYRKSRVISCLFFIVWLGVLCACLLQTQIGILIDIKATQQVQRCIPTSAGTVLLYALAIIPMANDLLIFCATTYKLISTASMGDPTPKKRIMAAIFGTYLPTFSRTLLHDGQAYFLTLFPIYIFTIVFSSFYPNHVSLYGAMAAFPSVVLANLMACKIYRKTRLGIHTASETNFSKPSQEMVFNRSPPSFTPKIDVEQNSIASLA